MRVHFTRFECEEDYDYALCGDSTVASDYYYELLTGDLGTDFWSAFIPVDKYYIRFVADYSDTDWGFKIDQYEALKDPDTHYLCSYDSLPDSQDRRFSDYMLDSKLDELNCSEKYVVIDSCYSGGMISEVQEIGRYIMTACDEDEPSYESSSLEHGIFTNYFLKSTNLSSDSNGDGVRSMKR